MAHGSTGITVYTSKTGYLVTIIKLLVTTHYKLLLTTYRSMGAGLRLNIGLVPYDRQRAQPGLSGTC